MNIITTTEQLQEFVDAYIDAEAWAFDVETIGTNRGQPAVNDVCWISFAKDDRVDVIPMGHPNGEFQFFTKPILKSGLKQIEKRKPLADIHMSKNKERWEPQFGDPPKQLTRAEVFKALTPLMFGKALKIGHNVKFDLKSVAKYYKGKVPRKPFFDTLMASFIINNDTKNKLSLKECVKRELGVDMEKGIGEDISKHSFEHVANYSAIDAELTWKLYKKLVPQIIEPLQTVWKLEMSVLEALCYMELTGATIDVNALKTLDERLAEERTKAEGRCYKAVGKVFNLNSVQEKQEHLYGGEKPRVIHPKDKFGNYRNPNVLTPKGKELFAAGKPLEPKHFSTAADVLQPFKGKDEFVDALLEYMDINKLLTTYVTPYLGGEVKRMTNGKEKLEQKASLLINGRVFTKFNAHGAETGRFSSSEPNLQNIPSSGEFGKLVRNLFIAPPGHKLVVADYSQIEPRVIASLSRDPVMMKNYLEGGDIYTTIGDTMDVDRKAGKVLVLSIAYGVGPEKIAQSIGCTVDQAKKLLNDFEKKFASISRYKAKVIKEATNRSPYPYVQTILGRRRYIPDLRSRDFRMLARAERQAFNTVIQGSAADIMKLALARAHSCFVGESDINLVLTVHDELVTVTPDHMAEETAEYIRKSMEGVKLDAIKVPLLAEVTIVDKWGDAK